MKYKLNYDWDGYKKERILEATNEKGISLHPTDSNGTWFIHNDMIDLLLKSGALSEVKDCEHKNITSEICDTCGVNIFYEKYGNTTQDCSDTPKLPEPLEFTFNGDWKTPPTTIDLTNTVNAIIKYLQSK